MAAPQAGPASASAVSAVPAPAPLPGGAVTAAARCRVVVLVSGAGTLLGALLDAAADGAPFEVVAAGADRPAPGLERPRAAGLPVFVEPLTDHPDRSAWDRALAERIAAHRPDLVVLAGFMRLLGPAVLERWGGRVVNTHPALLPSFPGAHAVRDALAHGVRVSGATAILVDAGVDTGPVLAQRAVEVLDGDDEASLHERIKVVERSMLVDVITRMVRDGWSVSDRKVVFS